jgi:hypothetical protein
MTSLKLVKDSGYTWSDISIEVGNTLPLPVSPNRCGNQQIFYCVVALSCERPRIIKFYLSQNGLWYPGSKAPKYRDCLFGDIGIAWEAIIKSKGL